MTSAIAQLPLGFQIARGASLANYVPGPNVAACRSLEMFLSGQGEQVIYLWGGRGTGKSHLLEAACRAMRSQGVEVGYVPLRAQAGLKPLLLEGLERLPLVCVDDTEQVAGRLVWEEGLFHLYNRSMSTGTRLLITGAASPAGLGLQLPDLVSRLSASLVYQLRPLAESERVAAMQRWAHDRGFELPEEAALYLIRRQPRDIRSLLVLVERLDQASLAAQRRVTIPFIREVMAQGPE